MNISGHLERLAALYAEMDRAYGRIAARHGFACHGCEDNCCTQRFFHNTYAEYLYLLEGVKQMDPARRELVFRRASVAVQSYFHEIQVGETFSLMCPLNFDGLCSVYEWRPMICRLHGLPHFFTMPDGSAREGEGCRSAPEAAAKLDRTPFYRELADIEREVRIDTGYRERIKKTTAQFLVEMMAELEEDEN